MTVAFDNASAAKVTNSTSVTISLAVTPNACLVVSVGLKGVAGLSVSAVFANGVQMTQFARVETGGSSPINNHLFVLTSSPSGTVSISANIVGAARLMGIGACSYVGHSSTNCFSATVATAGNVASVNFTVSHSSIDRVVLIGGNTNSLQSNCTVRVSNGSNYGFYMADTVGPNTATGNAFSFSASMSLNGTAVHSYIGLNISAARATMTLSQFRMLTGVGF